MRATHDTPTSIRLIMLAVFIVALVWIDVGRTSIKNQKAIETLHTMGFTNIQVMDKSIWFVSMDGCSGGDGVSFDCMAVNPKGDRVNVLVCCGYPFKGCTARNK